MATEQKVPILTTSEVNTTFTGPPTLSEPAPPDSLYPPQGPDPAGTTPSAVEQMEQGVPANPDMGIGIEGEETVWDGRYAFKNFVGRLTLAVVLSIAWLVLAVYTWGYSEANIAPLTIFAGLVLVAGWVWLLYRILQARFGHHYRLTTRRLFVATGMFRRRRDMMELLRVKDVFTQQTLLQRWISLGTVVVVSSDKDLPTFYLPGVDDPKRVMDLIWHHARSERDRRSVKVESV